VVDGYVESALAAATEVGRRAGLPADAPEVLASSANVLVRMGPVVARVPGSTLLGRADVAERLACDVAISAFLAERDAPVIPPWEDPGPHVAGGLPVTLWPYTRHDPGHRFGPAEVAASLAELHAALRDYPGDLPAGPLAEIRHWLDLVAGEVPVDGLRAALDAIALPGGPVQALHGDAHASNALATADGLRWLDFEDTGRGPVGWDLACLARSRLVAGNAAVAAYPGFTEDLAPYLELRTLFGLCWQLIVARRFPERLAGARAAVTEYLASR